jgi:hypothetical protein
MRREIVERHWSMSGKTCRFLGKSFIHVKLHGRGRRYLRASVRVRRRLRAGAHSSLVCVCACVRACVRACMHASHGVRARERAHVRICK